MAGAVLNCINIRLNAQTIAFLLEHSSSKVVMADQEYFSLVEEALKIISDKHKKGSFQRPLLVVIGDENCDPNPLHAALKNGAVEYENFLEAGDPEFAWKPPKDEWQSIAIGYTSGTTSSPKGVVLHHRGAYLMALSAALVWGINEGAVYLWTLPMFHCNGWCYPWSLAAICGTSICLRQVLYMFTTVIPFLFDTFLSAIISHYSLSYIVILSRHYWCSIFPSLRKTANLA